MAQMVKNLAAIAGDGRDAGSIPSQEDSLEKEMATQSSIFAWEIPWTEEPDGPQSMGCIKVGHNLATKNRSISKDHVQRIWNSCLTPSC